MTSGNDAHLGGACSPRPVERLLRALEETPETGRDALVTSRLHELRGNRTHSAAHLLRVLATSELRGVRAATVAGLAATVHPSTILRCLIGLPAARSYPIRHICGTLRWQDALLFVSEVRDGRRSLGPYVGFTDDVLTLGSLLASDTHLPYGHNDPSLHRSSGAETIFLFGAARDPGELLREIERHSILTSLHPNYDENLTRWALANPALSGKPRLHAISQNSAQVVASLRHEGMLRLTEVASWLRTGTGAEIRDRSVSVLNLPEYLPGSRALKVTTIGLIDDLSELTPHLAGPARQSITRVLSSDPGTAEIVEGLLPEWRSKASELLAAARSLRGNDLRSGS